MAFPLLGHYKVTIQTTMLLLNSITLVSWLGAASQCHTRTADWSSLSCFPHGWNTLHEKIVYFYRLVCIVLHLFDWDVKHQVSMIAPVETLGWLTIALKWTFCDLSMCIYVYNISTCHVVPYTVILSNNDLGLSLMRKKKKPTFRPSYILVQVYSEQQGFNSVRDVRFSASWFNSFAFWSCSYVYEKSLRPSDWHSLHNTLPSKPSLSTYAPIYRGTDLTWALAFQNLESAMLFVISYYFCRIKSVEICITKAMSWTVRIASLSAYVTARRVVVPKVRNYF